MDNNLDNNLDTMTFYNHDTYVFYPAPLLFSEHRISLPPVNDDTDIVIYSSFKTDIYSNGVKDGLIKVNKFQRNSANDETADLIAIYTFVTSKGILNFNYSNSLVIKSNLFVIGQNISTYATYKSGIYSKYLYVKIHINIENNDYRVITISY